MRTVTTIEELNALAEDAVVRDGYGDVHVKAEYNWAMAGDDGDYKATDLGLPAVVLYDPEEKVEVAAPVAEEVTYQYSVWQEGYDDKALSGVYPTAEGAIASRDHYINGMQNGFGYTVDDLIVKVRKKTSTVGDWERVRSGGEGF